MSFRIAIRPVDDGEFEELLDWIDLHDPRRERFSIDPCDRFSIDYGASGGYLFTFKDDDEKLALEFKLRFG